MNFSRRPVCRLLIFRRERAVTTLFRVNCLCSLNFRFSTELTDEMIKAQVLALLEKTSTALYGGLVAFRAAIFDRAR
ncbi:succinyl-diaminopimelate desuccinylase [Escherichia coli]|uniref:Succinyl-diaminopimelate desuccinylase n=1 Tax=Escherichia coli TaxID=562 RepID=A0A376TVB7_ECOLX|nr:succinyl-diaminopimelate desuccinylase [Escherichia coli]